MFRVPTATGRSSSARDVLTHRQQPFRSPKVVSIPVHFVDSEISSSTSKNVMSRSTAVLKIQKVWRGFVVRKNVNKILGIKREVDAIEKKISDKETADLIRGDAKERLKVNEMLMALLFRLDSIRGVDLGVRDCRKRVIKKVIMLQEKVDAIASGDADEKEESQNDGNSAEPVEATVLVPLDGAEDQMRLECSTGLENSNSVAEVGEGETESCLAAPVNGESVQDEHDQSSEVEEGYLLVKREGECEGEKDAMEVQQPESEAAGNDSNKSNGLMEKMIERNEMLIGLVSELCERNKIQTQMINSLSKRVDNLERSFRTERSKCKRRKQQQIARC